VRVCWAGTAVPDRGVLRGRRAGGVITLPGSVWTRGAAASTLCDGLSDTTLRGSAKWLGGGGGSGAGSLRRRVDGADTECALPDRAALVGGSTSLNRPGGRSPARRCVGASGA
jgi:hypothetical protein